MGNKEQDKDREKVVSETLINLLRANIPFLKDLLQKQKGEPAYELSKQVFVENLTTMAESMMAMGECSNSCLSLGISKQEIEVGIKHLLGIESELAPVK